MMWAGYVTSEAALLYLCACVSGRTGLKVVMSYSCDLRLQC